MEVYRHLAQAPSHEEKPEVNFKNHQHGHDDDGLTECILKIRGVDEQIGELDLNLRDQHTENVALRCLK